MKALIIERQGEVRVWDVPEPPMGEYDARCEMLYGATCTGTDLHIIDGKFYGYPTTYPSVIGHESIGRVVEVGSKVRNYKVGDLVTRVSTRPNKDCSLTVSFGGMCQFGLACDHRAMWLDGRPKEEYESYCVHQVIPKEIISPIDATMIITWRETLSYIQRIGIKNGDNVFISGSGGNGLSLAAMSKIMGAVVYMSGSLSRKNVAMEVGVDVYLNYKDQNAVSNMIDSMQGKFEYIIDATGKSGSLDPYMTCIAQNGTIGVYGMDDMNNYHLNPYLAGRTSFRIYNGDYYEPETHDQVINLIREGHLKADPWLDKKHIFTWGNACDLYDYVRDKKAIKAVLALGEG